MIRHACDEGGKYLFANFVEISVEGGGRLLFLAFTAWTFLLAFFLVCSERSLSSHTVVTCGKGISHSGTPERHTSGFRVPKRRCRITSFMPGMLQLISLLCAEKQCCAIVQLLQNGCEGHSQGLSAA